MAPVAAMAIGPAVQSAVEATKGIQAALQKKIARVSINEDLDLCTEKEEAYGFDLTTGLLLGAGALGLVAYAVYARNKFWKENIGKVTGMVSGIQDSVGGAGQSVQDALGKFGAWVQGK